MKKLMNVVAVCLLLAFTTNLQAQDSRTPQPENAGQSPKEFFTAALADARFGIAKASIPQTTDVLLEYTKTMTTLNARVLKTAQDRKQLATEVDAARADTKTSLEELQMTATQVNDLLALADTVVNKK